MGRNDKSNILYPIDFGISKKYRDNNNKHIPFTDNKNLVGTARYSSINDHLGYEQSRRDDMESLGYMFVYFMKGRLPWQGITGHDKKEKYQKILKKKQTLSCEELCSNIPIEFARYIELCRQLKFEEEPPYLEMRKMFWSVAKREGIKFDGIFDWYEMKQDK